MVASVASLFNNGCMIDLDAHFSRSRLLVGTGRYADMQTAESAIAASGASIVTVAIRRLPTEPAPGETLFEMLARLDMTILPNSAACFNVEDTLRTLRLGRELVGHPLTKLEVLTDPQSLMPNEPATLEAAKILVAEGFQVMAYTTDNLELAQQLAEVGCVAIMPIGAPIGTGQGIREPQKIRDIRNALPNTKVMIDAGLGTASEAAAAMELGCDAILVNTAIAQASDSARMAEAFKLATQAGYIAAQAGRIPVKEMAVPSSPMDGAIANKAS